MRLLCGTPRPPGEDVPQNRDREATWLAEGCGWDIGGVLYDGLGIYLLTGLPTYSPELRVLYLHKLVYHPTDS